MSESDAEREKREKRERLIDQITERIVLATHLVVMRAERKREREREQKQEPKQEGGA